MTHQVKKNTFKAYTSVLRLNSLINFWGMATKYRTYLAEPITHLPISY